jgi:signal transduction histidine kinase
VKPRDVPVNSSLSRVQPETVARLEATRRLATGAAHTLNNAFTTVIGEASFLLEDRKHDAVVEEACHAILTELERCARLTRALLARHWSGQSGSGEVDLSRLVRDVSVLLSETLGRNNQLTVETPEELLLVAGDANALELVVLTLTQYAAERGSELTKLTLAVDAEPSHAQVRLRIAAEGAQHPDAMAEAVLDPARAPDEVTRLSLDTVARIVGEHRGSRYASATGPDAWAALIVLPELRQDDRA